VCALTIYKKRGVKGLLEGTDLHCLVYIEEALEGKGEIFNALL
jgi:hypothetical protein